MLQMADPIKHVSKACGIRNFGPIRTRPYFVFVSLIRRPIHEKNKIWSSADWPLVRERRALEAGRRNL